MNGSVFLQFDGQGMEFKSVTSWHRLKSLPHGWTTRPVLGDSLKSSTAKRSGIRAHRRRFTIRTSDNDRSMVYRELQFREELIHFAKTAQTMRDPTSFRNAVTPEARASMKHIISRMLGTVSHQYFEISYSSMTEQCKTLFLSILISGYMLKNAQDRVDLARKLHHSAGKTDHWEPHAKTHGGDVVRWRNDNSPESLSAKEYIARLESRIEALEQTEEERRQSGIVDPLVEYFRKLDNRRLEELANSASEEVLLAMHVCSEELLSSKEPTTARMACSLPQKEMSRLMEWLMTFGYNLRCKELKYEMEKAFSID